MSEWMSEWMSDWMNEWMREWMNEWMTPLLVTGYLVPDNGSWINPDSQYGCANSGITVNYINICIFVYIQK